MEETPAPRKLQMYCIVAADALKAMKGIRGKLATQAGHAYLHAFWDAEERFPELAKLYRDGVRAYKITLVVPTTDDLVLFQQAYRPLCGVSLVTDAGFTVFDGPTTTCLGIGPIWNDRIGDALRDLKTLT